MKEKKIKETKGIYGHNLRSICFVTFTTGKIVTLFSVMFSVMFSTNSMANTTAITAGMSAEVAAEFNKQFNKPFMSGFIAALNPEAAAAVKKELKSLGPAKMSDKLTMMDNPYEKFTGIIDDKMSDKNSAGYQAKYHRRLLTHDESIVEAKRSRFGECQTSIVKYIGFAGNAHTFSTAGLTKEEIMNGNIFGIDYPFTAEQRNDDTYRPGQIALELGWQYKGRENAEAHVDVFFKTCLDIPIDIYYWEDTFDND